MSDGQTTTELKPFSIRVDAPPPANTTPVISGNPADHVVAGMAYNFTPTASDLEGDELAFSVQNKPGWASFNASTGRLYGTPTNAHVGYSGNIIIQVSDGSSIASLAAFGITVSGTSSGTGNVNQSFVPNPADYLYVDLNRKTNGSGLTPNDPMNRIPNQLGDRRQLFFNSDNGVQTLSLIHI